MPDSTFDGLLLAIDAGGSVVKATAFDLAERRNITVSRPVPPTHPAPGRSERDPEQLWAATASCIREVLARVDGGPQRIVAVGLTAHGNGLYLVDSAGQPTRAAIMAADTRAASLVRRWAADGLEELLRARSWNGLWAGQPGPILSVLAATEPDVLGSARAALSCKDYLWAKLTGVVETELTAASAGGLYDSTAWAAADGDEALGVSAPAVDAFGLQRWRHLLATPIAPETIRDLTREAAEATGLPVGTPVVAGVVDNAAVQHGSGVFDGSAICVGAGTWSINQVLVPMEVAADQAALIRPYAANIALDQTALLCEASPTSASNLDWAINQAIRGHKTDDNMLGLDVYDAQMRREGKRARRLNDPMFLPFVDGSRADSGARGAWLGLSSATGEDDLLGAVVEGICFEHRRHVDRLQATLPAPLPVRLSGGATKSDLWCRRFADTLGVPVQVSPVAQLGSVCAAAMAGVSAGVFRDVSHGVTSLNPAWLMYTPDPTSQDFIENRYARYTHVAELLDRMPWEES